MNTLFHLDDVALKPGEGRGEAFGELRNCSECVVEVDAVRGEGKYPVIVGEFRVDMIERGYACVPMRIWCFRPPFLVNGAYEYDSNEVVLKKSK